MNIVFMKKVSAIACVCIILISMSGCSSDVTTAGRDLISYFTGMFDLTHGHFEFPISKFAEQDHEAILSASEAELEPYTVADVVILPRFFESYHNEYTVMLHGYSKEQDKIAIQVNRVCLTTDNGDTLISASDIACRETDAEETGDWFEWILNTGCVFEKDVESLNVYKTLYLTAEVQIERNENVTVQELQYALDIVEYFVGSNSYMV